MENEENFDLNSDTKFEIGNVSNSAIEDVPTSTGDGIEAFLEVQVKTELVDEPVEKRPKRNTVGKAAKNIKNQSIEIKENKINDERKMEDKGSAEKKKRGSNFSQDEKKFLISLVESYKYLIENKKTDAVTNSAKNNAWVQLAGEFNANSIFCHRTADQLKSCWENLKRQAKKDKAKQKKATCITGGCKLKNPPHDPLLDAVEAIICHSLVDIYDEYDSDAQYNTATQTNEDSDKEGPFERPSSSPASAFVTQGTQTLAFVDTVENDVCIEAAIKEINNTNSKKENLVKAKNKDTEYIGWSPGSLKSDDKVKAEIVSNPGPAKEKLNKIINISSSTQRTRPNKSSLETDGLSEILLQKKIELTEVLKRNAEIEAQKKILILDEQIEQEKLKTQLLQMELKKAIGSTIL